MDLSFIPIWAYFVAGGVIAGLIYYYSEETTKSSIKNVIKSYGVWIGIFLVYLWGRYNWEPWADGDFFISKANTFLVVAGLLWFGANQLLGSERYKSTQAICDNRSGSCASYQEVGDYVVLNIGSCDANMFPWDFGNETWVVPKRHFNKINNNPNSSKTQIKIDTCVQKCDLTEVPAICSDFIETTTGYNKENIFHGQFSMSEINTVVYLLEKGTKISKIKEILSEQADKEYVQNILLKDLEGGKLGVKINKKGYLTIKDSDKGKEIDLDEYEIKLKDANRMINERGAMVKGKTNQILGYISHVGTIMRKAKGKEARQSTQPESEY